MTPFHLSPHELSQAVQRTMSLQPIHWNCMFGTSPPTVIGTGTVTALTQCIAHFGASAVQDHHPHFVPTDGASVIARLDRRAPLAPTIDELVHFSVGKRDREYPVAQDVGEALWRWPQAFVCVRRSHDRAVCTWSRPAKDSIICMPLAPFSLFHGDRTLDTRTMLHKSMLHKSNSSKLRFSLGAAARRRQHHTHTLWRAIPR